ncbi:MAG: hypothetical protein WCI31_16595 [Prolixibacteraceae bacterium]
MKELLLPYKWRYLGWVFTSVGAFLAILYYFFDFNFVMPVFAIHSSFLETKMFAFITNNFADELILLLLTSGLGLLAFTQDKIEYEYLETIRSKAMGKALLTNMIFLVLSILFIYGSGFIAVLIANTLSIPLLYLLFFRILKSREKSIGRSED